MTSKLETTFAELTKLKNQIRVELNRIRPSKEILVYEKPERSAKKICYKKYSQTNIIQPPTEKSQVKMAVSRRHFQNNSLVHIDCNKQKQRKHYDKQYNDKVDMGMNVRRRRSAYLNVKTQKDVSPLKQEYGNSLYGIGSKDRSNTIGKSGKKIYHQRIAYNYDFL